MLDKTRNRLFGLLPQTKKTIFVGAPIVAAQLLQMSMGFVDTVMAGKLGAAALAAVGVGGSLYAPVLLLIMGTLMSVNPIVAQLHGRGQKKRIGQNCWQVLWLAGTLSVPVFFVYRHMTSVMLLFGIKAEVIPVAQGYLEALSWGAPAIFGYFALRFFNEGLTITRPSMYFALIGLGVNIVANYVFMFGHWGVPAMGAVGTGWATTLVQWVMFTCMAAFTFRRSNEHRFSLYKGFALPRWQFQRELLSVGFPNGLSISIEVSIFAIVALVIGSLGVKIIAAHQVTINFAAFTFMMPLGLSFATSARVGFAIGKNDLSEARQVGFVGALLSLLVMSCTAFVMLVFPEAIVRIYTNDPEVRDIAVKLLMLAGIFQISDGLQVAGFGALRGLKDTRIPMLVNLLAYWFVGLPCGYILGIMRGSGAEGLWIGLIAGLSVAAVLHNLRFHKLTRPRQAKGSKQVPRPAFAGEGGHQV